MPTYQKLNDDGEEEKKIRNFDCAILIAKNERIETGVVATSRNISFIGQNLALNSAKSARFRTGRLRNNQINCRRRVVTKVQWQK